MANFAIRCHVLIKLGDGSQPGEGRAVTGDRVARPAPVTLNDVAREADVAVSTVSRALSNPERVSRATREHVQAVARRLGYQANRSAGGSQMLALLIHDVTNPYNFGLIRGAEAQARAAGYTLILCHTQESPELETTHAERLLIDGRRPDAGRQPATGRTTARDRRPSAGRAVQPPTRGFRQRRPRFGRRQQADRRTPACPRSSQHRLPRRPAECLDQ